MNRNKKLILILIFFGFILIISGSYAMFAFSKSGETSRLLAGDIYMDFDNTTSISLSNVFPMSIDKARELNNNTITFTISGTNVSEKDIYYDIKLLHGNDSNNTRFWDYDITFDLGYYDDGDLVYLLEGNNLEKIDHTSIYTETISADTVEFTRKYFMRFWISENAIISDSADVGAHYRATNSTNTNLPIYKDCTSIIKVEVDGDLINRDSNSTTNIYKFMKTGAVLDSKGDSYSASGDGYGKFIFHPTNNDEYPVYYLRDKDSGFVKIGDTCWKTMRTTEHGGTKLVYFGESGPVYDKNYLYLYDVTNNVGNYNYNIDTNKFYKTFSQTLSDQDLYFSSEKTGSYVLEIVARPQSGSYGSSSFSFGIYKNGVQFNGWGGGGNEEIYKTMYFDLDNSDDEIRINLNVTSSGTSTNQFYIEYTIYTTGDYVLNPNGCSLRSGSILVDGENTFKNDSANGDSLINTFAGLSYMYGDLDEASFEIVEDDENLVYAEKAIFNPGNNRYSLKGFKNFHGVPDINHRYTVLTNDEEYFNDYVSSIYYTFQINDSINSDGYYEAYMVLLENGETFNEHLNRVFEPIHDSNYKRVVDKFYEEHLYKYTNMFEDEVYCNNKMIKLFINSYGFRDEFPGSMSRSMSEMDLTCPYVRDSYTVSKERGNGALKYPIGLMTIDESYLMQFDDAFEPNSNYLTMSPGRLSPTTYWEEAGFGSLDIRNGVYIAPVVTLKNNVNAIGGTGTKVDPFVVVK